MAITASKLRENVYRLLDQVLKTGVPLEIRRRGRILKIIPADPVNKLENIIPRKDFLKCDPDDIVHLDWSGEWRP
jgi:hypothetical protein